MATPGVRQQKLSSASAITNIMKPPPTDKRKNFAAALLKFRRVHIL
jgi:hypothetical protein